MATWTFKTWWDSVTTERREERSKQIYRLARKEANERIIISRDTDGRDYIYFDGVKITLPSDEDILYRLNEIKQDFVVKYHSERM